MNKYICYHSKGEDRVLDIASGNSWENRRILSKVELIGIDWGINA